MAEDSTKTVPTVKEQPESSQQPVRPVGKGTGRTVHLINLTNRNLELDFGRDKELRIPAFGEADMPKDLLEHPAFLTESACFLVS